MMKHKLARLGLLSCCLILSGLPLAMGQPGEGGPRGGFDPSRFFDRMDANSDGVLTSDEFRGPADRFQAADADGDGKVTREEMQSGMERMREQFGDPGRWRERMNERLKEQLGATDEEWIVLQPKIDHINELRMPMGMGMGMAFGGFGMGPGGPGGPGGDRDRPRRRGGMGEPSAEATALQEALDNENTSAERLQERLDAFRKARDTREAELKTAREELRELVTARQEAVLVLNGTLD